MSGKHTPGPWHDAAPMNPGGAARRVITGGEKGIPHIAYIPTNSYAARAEEAEANARLIAAAPGLLAACKALLADAPYADLGDECECGEDGAGNGGTCCHILARRAIQKAEG